MTKSKLLRFIDDVLLKMRFKQKGILLVAVPLAFELLFITILSLAYVQAENDSAIASHGRRVLVLIDGMTNGLFAWGAAAIISKSILSEQAEARSQAVQSTLEELGEELVIETRGYPVEAAMVQKMMTSLKALTPQGVGYRQLLSSRFGLSAAGLRNSRNEAKNNLKALAKTLDELVAYEQTTSSPHALHAKQSRQALNLIWSGGIAANGALSIWIALVFGNQITRRLEVVGRNAARLARAEPLTESLTGSDELSELDAQMQILAVKAIETSLRERAIIDNTADLILVLAPDLTIRTANAAAPRLLGWSVISLSDLPVLDLVATEDRNAFAKGLSECRSSREIRNLDFLVLKSDGDVLETRWSVLWSESENSFFCLVRDISSEKRADAARQKFFAMVTHDIRSPLTTLYSFLDQLSNGNYGSLNSSGLKILARVNENVVFLTDLTNDLLELGRLQSGVMTLCRSEFKGDVLIDEACCLVETAALAKSIKLNVVIPDSFTLCGDFIRLKQALVNLMTNAVKFSPERGVVTVRMDRTDGIVTICVHDEGQGVPGQDISRVFDAYAQADNQAQSTVKGYGLGLSIVKGIIDAHGGEVGATNSDSGGTTFWLKLPAKVENEI